MRLLLLVFLGMFVYGIWAGMHGGAIIALGMLVFIWLAERVFAAQDKAYDADPRNARALGPSTNDALTEHDCECMRSRF
jgi:hypothetical protein